ncbi:hypothetical protein [Burkholderia sp. WP9]|uniref:hypothetical protein n=1 Tax=Burkholderia sp. WP9 TaxID=1500263 RepID=UPI00115FD1E4|nr:hypothetical protein [Burkholderia sp. WP9]
MNLAKPAQHAAPVWAAFFLPPKRVIGPAPARTGLSTSVTGRPLKILKRSLKHCLEIEFQSKERSVLNRRLRYILGDEIHHRTQDAASVV